MRVINVFLNAHAGNAVVDPCPHGCAGRMCIGRYCPGAWWITRTYCQYIGTILPIYYQLDSNVLAEYHCMFFIFYFLYIYIFIFYIRHSLHKDLLYIIKTEVT